MLYLHIVHVAYFVVRCTGRLRRIRAYALGDRCLYSRTADKALSRKPHAAGRILMR